MREMATCKRLASIHLRQLSLDRGFTRVGNANRVYLRLFSFRTESCQWSEAGLADVFADYRGVLGSFYCGAHCEEPLLGLQNDARDFGN